MLSPTPSQGFRVRLRDSWQESTHGLKAHLQSVQDQNTHPYFRVHALLGDYGEEDQPTSPFPTCPLPHLANSLGSQRQRHFLGGAFLKQSDRILLTVLLAPDQLHGFPQFRESLHCVMICLISFMRESAIDGTQCPPQHLFVNILTPSEMVKGVRPLRSGEIRRVEGS